jgi:hypothetical protein
MEIECGGCGGFVEQTERDFGSLLDRYGFRPVKCVSIRDSRECKLMVESDELRLLFVRSDGAETCQLGSPQAGFPEHGLYSQGDTGWYNVITLLEFRYGKKLLTPRRLKELMEHKPDYYSWQAKLLAENAESLFELFGDAKRGTWEDEFLQFYRKSLES